MMHEPYIFNGTKQRLDDAFAELETQRNRMSGLTREQSDIKKELLKIHEEIKAIRIGIGILLITLIMAMIIGGVING